MENVKYFLESNIIYYVVVPIFLFVLEKMIYMKKSRNNREMLLKWRYKPRKICPFHLVFTSFQMAALICLASIGTLFEYLGYETGCFFFILSSSLYLIIFLILLKNHKVRTEFLKHKIFKKFLCLFSGFILIYIFAFTQSEFNINIIVYGFLLGENYIVYQYSDKIYIYEEKYATVYTNNGDIIKMIFVETMEKHDKWIYCWGYDDEKGMLDIRIKEELIERIDYFGGKLILVKNPFDDRY